MKDQTEPLFGDNGGTFATPQVRNVTDELEGASTGKWTWGVGDIAANPIRLAPTPVDVAKAQHLVSAENPAFASVTKVFSYLAAKVATLKQEVRVALPPPPCGYRALQDVAAGRVPAASCRGAALRLAASATGHAGCSDVCTTLSPLRAAIPLAPSAQPKKTLVCPSATAAGQSPGGSASCLGAAALERSQRASCLFSHPRNNSSTPATHAQRGGAPSARGE